MTMKKLSHCRKYMTLFINVLNVFVMKLLYIQFKISKKPAKEAIAKHQ